MNRSAGQIGYDVESIRSEHVRRSFDSALRDLSLQKRRGVWDSLLRPKGGGPHSTTLVVADLHQVTGGSQLDHCSAGPSNIVYVFLIRTAKDRRRLRDPEIALRLNDRKFFLLDLESLPSREPGLSGRLADYFSSLVERLEPDRIRFARFAAHDSLVLIEFNDGLERAIPWAELAFSARTDFVPVSASAAEHGQSMLLLDRSGRELDVDAGVLRALVDPAHQFQVSQRDLLERQSTGRRIREIREEFGLSQQELSSRSGIPQESLSRLENGRRDPRLDTLRRLAAGFDIALSDLLARMGR